jgi:hypothetical protein
LFKTRGPGGRGVFEVQRVVFLPRGSEENSGLFWIPLLVMMLCLGKLNDDRRRAGVGLVQADVFKRVCPHSS